MAGADEHLVVIERRGTAHTARCRCGWSGHSWNELRPAEADAWHHTFGDSRVVEARPVRHEPWSDIAGGPGAASPGDAAAERIVARALALAAGTSPHSRRTVEELVQMAGGDPAALRTALSEVIERLRRHSQRTAGAADHEWLQLRTARRLLEEAVAEHASVSGR